ncbi:hypothetical protein D5S18_26300 [Nocardia panacis]|uniref:WXG100 family type VII secretion target n=1 Tax=Nocardia panacis TaxID=2340916 RepID=A0A3A4JP08_9NOCA|nr:hypothetical protein [Nocardia panacis]RJO70718.1 hypothetical protein D5S18_26300 [Nocardia panacis]
MVGIGDNSFGIPSESAGDKTIEVSPGDLHVIGHRFTTAASDADENFARHHTDLEDYSSTVFGATRAALMNKVEDWRARTEHMVHRVEGHGRTLHSSAIEYRAAEDKGRAGIEKAGGRG